MQIITSENFESEVLQSTVPVLVKFTAEWCKPCSAIQPVLESVAKELEGKAKIVKLDIDDSSEIANQFKVKSIPTMIAFKDGKAINTRTGSTTSKSDIIAMFELK